MYFNNHIYEKQDTGGKTTPNLLLMGEISEEIEVYR